MRAMAIDRFGGPDELRAREIDRPTPGEHDILIEVHATAVNPVDCKIRQAGLGRPVSFPAVLGFDVSGVVRGVGARVDRFRLGDEVYASPSLGRPGADAEFVCVDARTAARKPTNLSHEEAAALPLVTITAWESLHKRARIHRGETVLIHAGAGGVGHVAVQLAKEHGCRVLTTAGREESLAFCRKLGADVAIDYRRENVAERVKAETGGKGCGVVFDTVGGDVFKGSLDCVGVNGRLVTILGPPADAPIAKLFRINATLHLEFMGAATIHGVDPQSQGELLATAAELVEAGRLRPHVSRVVPLEALSEAHRDQESGRTLGKIVVRVKEAASRTP